jgi:hypothetical protein
MVAPFFMSGCLLLFLFFLWSCKEDSNPQKSQDPWRLHSSTRDDDQEYFVDWNHDGSPERLGTVFLGAGAQSHFNIVLSDGKTGNEIFCTYAFNSPRFGYFQKVDGASILFVKVLGNLKEVLDSPLDAITWPAPVESSTAVALCYSYYRLLEFREGRFMDASGDYPGLLWWLIKENEFYAFEDASELTDEIVEIKIVELLYFQIRTGVSVSSDLLRRDLPIQSGISQEKILQRMEQLAENKSHLAQYFALEKQALLANQ